MKKSFFFLIVITSLFACVPEDHVLEIEIVNNTSSRVQNLKVFTAGEKMSFEADNLPPGQELAHTLQVPGNSADGQYTFRFTRSDGKEETATGSYLDDDKKALKKTLIFDIQEEGVNVEQRVLKTK